MLGATLSELRAEGLLRESVLAAGGLVAVKEAVLPFSRFPDVDPALGPEMRSTGEVMGIDVTFGRAFHKAELAAGTELEPVGTVFLSLNDQSKPAGLAMAKRLRELGHGHRRHPGHRRLPRRVRPTGRRGAGQGVRGRTGWRRGGRQDGRRPDRVGQGHARRQHACRVGAGAPTASRSARRRCSTASRASRRSTPRSPRCRGSSSSAASRSPSRSLQEHHAR